MWALARTGTRRPSLMHKLRDDAIHLTLCGLDMSGWSRAYFETPIPQVECLRCRKAL